MSTIPSQPFQWATDETFSSGPANGRVTRALPAGWPVVPQGAVPGGAAAIPHLNTLHGVTGDWLNYLSEIGFQNWSDERDLGSTNAIVSACYLVDANGGGVGKWICVGDEEAKVSTETGASWATLGTPTGISFKRVFSGATIVVALDGTNTVRTNVGSGAWSANVETAGDYWIGGIYEPDGGHYVIGGILDTSLDFGFLYTTNEAIVGVSDLSRYGNSFTVPTLGTTADAVRVNLVDDSGVYFADRGDGRILCLMSLRGSGSATVYQFVSADGGETWAMTVDVMTPTDDTAATGLKGLGYDSERDLWVAMFGDGELYSSPAGAESWIQGTGLGGSTLGGGSTGNLVVVNGVWAMTLTPAGQDYVIWSRDAGVTWRAWVVDPGIAYSSLAYSAARGQWLLTGGAASAYTSMSVGQAPLLPTP